MFTTQQKLWSYLYLPQAFFTNANNDKNNENCWTDITIITDRTKP